VTVAVAAAVLVPAIGTAMVYAPSETDSGPLALPAASETVVIRAHSSHETPLRPLVAEKGANSAPTVPLVARRGEACRARATMPACRDSSPAGSGRSESR
jgi:hypothetical protein